jgi:aconitate hydratase
VIILHKGQAGEHAALALKYLGQVCCRQISARIGWQNLINFGIVPLEFKNAADWDNWNN